jgi:uncharacterized damage-inducible protein DinB
MKRRHFFTRLGLTPLGLAHSATTWHDPFLKNWRDTFAGHWLDTKEYTLAVLDAMPPDGFLSKPNPVQMSFGEQLRHIAVVNVIYFDSFAVLPVPKDSLPIDNDVLKKQVSAGDKAAVRKFVAESFDYVSSVLSRLQEKDLVRKDLIMWKDAPPHSGTDLCLRAYMHTAHHRGQAIVYLRVRGIAPPGWKFEPKGA